MTQEVSNVGEGEGKMDEGYLSGSQSVYTSHAVRSLAQAEGVPPSHARVSSSHRSIFSK